MLQLQSKVKRKNTQEDAFLFYLWRKGANRRNKGDKKGYRRALDNLWPYMQTIKI
jgi:hypothetical protein